MLKLEDALEQLEVPGKHVPVYRRTGNGLKEFAFHARGTDEFMHSLNVSLASHSPYPIEIKFYEDGEWSDFRRLLADFDPTQQAIQPDRAKTQLR
ncbi:hypothetical protein BJL95_16545 [Methylomonas sp. LWB]|nr:hypothetical protein BJL95_16545 [Methylomonas sp. LWB]